VDVLRRLLHGHVGHVVEGDDAHQRAVLVQHRQHGDVVAFHRAHRLLAIVARVQGGLVPYVDAFVAWASVLATWMVARKVLENWLYWIVVDSVAAALYWSQGFQATAGLYVLYVVIAVRGYIAWRADLARCATSTAGPEHV